MGRGRKFAKDRKWCSGCKEWHFLADFNDNASRPCGKQDYCKACHAGQVGCRCLGHPPAVEPPVQDWKPATRRKKTGILYVIGNTEMCRYKIGATQNVEGRLRHLQGGSPVPLVLVDQKPVQDVYEEERMLHLKMAAFHTHGEWFQLTPEQASHLFQ